MISQASRCLVLCSLFALLGATSTSLAASPSSSARVSVCFSPGGNCTDVVVQALTAAQHQVFVQAYSFTSAPIAKDLTDAHKRGVKVMAVLDKANQTDQYSAATFLVNAGIPTVIDAQHAIAHNKVMVIDTATVLTGSFNFTTAAEERNAENLLVLTDALEIAQAYGANILTHAAHSYAYQRAAAGKAPGKVSRAQGTAARQESQESGRAGVIRGNQKSHIYHLPECPNYNDLSPATVVTFRSEQDAVSAGYRKAKNCS